MAHMSPYYVCSRKCAFLCMYMCMHAFICVHECMYRGAPGKATLCMCVYIWSTLLQHMANAMHQLPSHRVGRGELVVELVGHHLEQQIVHLKASKSETQTRNTRAARRSRRRASLADVVGPQKTILPSTRMTREYVRFFAFVDADVDALDRSHRGRLLDQQRHVAAAARTAFAPPHCSACRTWTATEPTTSSCNGTAIGTFSSCSSSGAASIARTGDAVGDDAAEGRTPSRLQTV